ncbi:hypothetical protein N9Z78_03620, partial [Akkermansiaceae bacterium]|nr:hypothetical protein [Akkermansiaceae bacterium]
MAVCLRGRHDLVRFLVEDTKDQLTFSGIARSNGGEAVTMGFGLGLEVQPEVGFARFGVGAVAGEAGVGQ